jgi:ankyrin repeat protein
MADINAKDNDGRTALHLAAENGHEAVVQLLLMHMVDVDVKDNDENGYEAEVLLLLEYKVDVDAKTVSQDSQ